MFSSFKPSATPLSLEPHTPRVTIPTRRAKRTIYSHSMNDHQLTPLQKNASAGVMHSVLEQLNRNVPVDWTFDADEWFYDSNIVTKSRKSPFYLAVEHGHIHIAEVLLACGANRQKAIADAIANQQPDVARALRNVQINSVTLRAAVVWAIAHYDGRKSLAFLQALLKNDFAEDELEKLIQYAEHACEWSVDALSEVQKELNNKLKEKKSASMLSNALKSIVKQVTQLSDSLTQIMNNMFSSEESEEKVKDVAAQLVHAWRNGDYKTLQTSSHPQAIRMLLKGIAVLKQQDQAKDLPLQQDLIDLTRFLLIARTYDILHFLVSERSAIFIDLPHLFHYMNDPVAEGLIVVLGLPCLLDYFVRRSIENGEDEREQQFFKELYQRCDPALFATVFLRNIHFYYPDERLPQLILLNTPLEQRLSSVDVNSFVANINPILKRLGLAAVSKYENPQAKRDALHLDVILEQLFKFLGAEDKSFLANDLLRLSEVSRDFNRIFAKVFSQWGGLDAQLTSQVRAGTLSFTAAEKLQLQNTLSSVEAMIAMLVRKRDEWVDREIPACSPKCNGTEHHAKMGGFSLFTVFFGLGAIISGALIPMDTKNNAALYNAMQNTIYNGTTTCLDAYNHVSSSNVDTICSSFFANTPCYDPCKNYKGYAPGLAIAFAAIGGAGVLISGLAILREFRKVIILREEKRMKVKINDEIEKEIKVIGAFPLPKNVANINDIIGIFESIHQKIKLAVKDQARAVKPMRFGDLEQKAALGETVIQINDMQPQRQVVTLHRMWQPAPVVRFHDPERAIDISRVARNVM